MKLNKLFLLLPFLLITGITIAQGYSEKEVIGNWKVAEVISTKTNNETQQKVVGGFKNSTFIFNADHSFVLKTDDKSIYITMLTRQLGKAQWQFNDATDEIKIGTPQNNYSILKIQMQHKNDGTLFQLEESGIGLVVNKN